MIQENKTMALGTEPVGKLLLQYSLPAIIGTTITSLYNIIDSIFIGHGVGPLAIAGLAITFPLMNLVVAFSTLVSAGASTISSIRLGQNDLKGAQEILGTTLILCLTNAVFFGLLAFLFLDPVLRFFGASIETLPYARDFMQVILLGTPVSYTMLSLNNIMRATGYPRKAMLTSLVTVITNIILAPTFIFYFHWGIRGAATATVISQAIGMVWVIHHFTRTNSLVHFMPGMWKLRARVVGNIYSIGMSPFLINVCACMIVIVINNTLQSYGGDLAIGAYGIINRLLTLYIMIVLGLTMGMQPIAGYNYGAMKMDRVWKLLRIGIVTGILITSSGFIICETVPHLVSSIFTRSDELIEIASSGLRICVLMFPLVGAQTVISNFFQSIGKAKVSIFLSLTRQLLYLLPGLLILPRYFGINGVWASQPIADFLAFVTAIFYLTYYRKRIGWKKQADINKTI
ncbi:MAG: MATE family efflux transporter [Bacteroides sp.]|nr:MATE family efflux transporter [Bacteroides sp.]